MKLQDYRSRKRIGPKTDLTRHLVYGVEGNRGIREVVKERGSMHAHMQKKRKKIRKILCLRHQEEKSINRVRDWGK